MTTRLFTLFCSIYTVRSQTESLVPRVYAPGQYTVEAGPNKPDRIIAKSVVVS